MKKKEQPDWYSVRCLFCSARREDMVKQHLYEERITVWRAASFDEAVSLAEDEAHQYAKDTDSEYIELAQAYHVYPKRLSSGSEVFSLMRESNHSPGKYLDRYFDTGEERQGKVPC